MYLISCSDILLSSPALGMTSVSSNPSALLGISIVKVQILQHCCFIVTKEVYFIKEFTISNFYAVIFLCQFECSQESVSLFLGRNGRVGKLNGSASKFEGEYVSLSLAQAFV